MYYIVDVLKAVACLLIINFHADIMFPKSISILAFGGDVGNNIFFFVSGFTLLKSVEKSNKFLKWYVVRLKKIFPYLIVFYLYNYLFGKVIINSSMDFFRAFVFPTIYWFSGAILLFYIIFYFVNKYYNEKGYLLIIIALLLISIFVEKMISERYIFGFLSMLIGAQIYRRKYEGKNNIICIVAILSLVVYVTLKVMNKSVNSDDRILCFGIGCSLLVLISSLLIFGINYQDKLEAFFNKHINIYKIIKIFGEITLLAYLLGITNDKSITRAISNVVVFPVSYLLNMFVLLGISYVVSRIYKIVIKSVRI